jgi:hypothetical protein
VQGDAQGEEVAAHPAILFGKRQAEQAKLAHPRDDLIRKLTSLVEAADHRCDHVARELGHDQPEILVLITQPVADHLCPFADFGRVSVRCPPASDATGGPDGGAFSAAPWPAESVPRVTLSCVPSITEIR